jgi:MFS transporter, YNFM family, putative membrane transport protein
LDSSAITLALRICQRGRTADPGFNCRVDLAAGRKSQCAGTAEGGFSDLLVQPGLVRMLVVGFGGFFVFSSTFNYLPFYLSSPPFSAPTEVITLVYLAYLVGLVTGPLSGRISNQIGSGATMIGGSLVLIAAVAATLIQSLAVIAISLVALCAGFFSVHSAAVGLLNRRLITSRGRANSLYVLAYYTGGAVGITACGYTYNRFAWSGVVALSITVLLLPLAIGLAEILQEPKQRRWVKSFT